MIKTLGQLSKEEKLSVLQALHRGEITKEELNKDSLFAFEYKDCFLGLMVAANQVEGAKVSVICLGEAQNAMNDLILAPK